MAPLAELCGARGGRGRQLPALGSGAVHMHGPMAVGGTWPPTEVGHKLQGLTHSTCLDVSSSFNMCLALMFL